jgi:hypothetical protein
MTVVTYERWTDYQERIWELEDALAEYLRVMQRVPFKVEGDLRGPFLYAHGAALAALPRDRWPSAPPRSVEAEKPCSLRSA